MRVVLIPGLMGGSGTLSCLKEKILSAGHTCYSPGFSTFTLLNNELNVLQRTIRELSPVVLVGHSAGSLLGLLLSLTDNSRIIGLIGMGTPMMGFMRPRMPYYEARSIVGKFLPLWGPNEIRYFNTTHASLPCNSGVQAWVIEKLQQIDEGFDKHDKVWYHGGSK